MDVIFENGNNGYILMNMIIAIGQALNLNVIAEGVFIQTDCGGPFFELLAQNCSGLYPKNFNEKREKQ